MKRAEIIWNDAYNLSEIRDRSGVALMSPLVRRNIGYIIEETPTHIILSTGIIEEHEETPQRFDGNWLILKSMITEIHTLGPA